VVVVVVVEVVVVVVVRIPVAIENFGKHTITGTIRQLSCCGTVKVGDQ